MTIKTSNIFNANTGNKEKKYLTVVIGMNLIKLSQAMLDKVQQGTELVNLSAEEYISENRVYTTFSEFRELMSIPDYEVKYIINTGYLKSNEGVHAESLAVRTMVFAKKDNYKDPEYAPIFFDCVEQLCGTTPLIKTSRTPEGELQDGLDIGIVKSKGINVVHIFTFRSGVVNTPDVYLEKAFGIGLNHFIGDKVRNLSLLVGPYGEQELIGDGETIPYVKPCRSALQ